MRPLTARTAVFIDESIINARRRLIYVDRIRRAIARIGVIDGCDAMALADDLVRSFDFALRHHLAEWSRVELQPMMGLGTPNWVRVRGRVAEKSKVQLPTAADEPFDILVSCWYRFLISGMPSTPILARRGEREVLTATDEEGFFDVTLSAQPELGDLLGGRYVELEVGDQATVRAEKELASVLMPRSSARLGLLVDLDGILFENPRSRFTQVLGEIVLGHSRRYLTPLDGLESFIGRMNRGGESPVFYISNAPRHLYNHVWGAIEYSGLPPGYVQLRDFDLRLREFTQADTDVLEVLEVLLAHEIIDHFPALKFVFVGTAHRLRSYATMLKAISHRLEGVYLFDEDEVSAKEVEALSRELAPLHIFASGGARLLADAVDHGWAEAG